jgi:DNA-directed RNA polymerase subunit D
MQFQNLKKVNDRTFTFTLTPTHVSYANTLRRLILTGVETVGFRADMTSTGTTTDVLVTANTTPMTNEMLAHRIGLLPVNVREPLKWDPDRYAFQLKASADKSSIKDVFAGDFIVVDKKPAEGSAAAAVAEPVEVPASTFFPPHPITKETCLLATFAAGSGQKIELNAKATIGTGRENARFIPVSQCSYEYTRDTDPERRKELFIKWLQEAKKVTYDAAEEESEKIKTLQREFATMEIARCYLRDETGEPYSFDFTVESVGILDVPYIVRRACEVGESMVGRYVNIEKGDLPSELTIGPADSRVIGFDFLFRGHDHTLGNLLQTWLVAKHIDGDASPRITFAGYKVPHPLRDEMVLRIGVEDGQEATARLAVAMACRGCVDMFREMRSSWESATGTGAAAAAAAAAAALKKPAGAAAAIADVTAAAAAAAAALKKPAASAAAAAAAPRRIIRRAAAPAPDGGVSESKGSD